MCHKPWKDSAGWENPQAKLLLELWQNQGTENLLGEGSVYSVTVTMTPTTEILGLGYL